MQNGKQILNNFGFFFFSFLKQKPLCLRIAIIGCSRGGVTLSSFPAAGTFVFGMPVLLLTLDGAVGSVPAAVVHGLLFTVVALGKTNEMGLPPWQDLSSPAHQYSPTPAHTSAEQCSSYLCSGHKGIFHACWVKQQSSANTHNALLFYRVWIIDFQKNHLSLKKTHLPQNGGLTFFSHTAQEPSFTLHLCNSTLIYVLKATVNQQALLVWTGSAQA